MTYCGEKTLSRFDGETHHAVTIRCKSWACADCGPDRKKQLIAQACQGQPNSFLTLTLRRSAAKSPIDAAKTLARCWRLIRLRIMRKLGKPELPFIAVFERHVSGWPHLHILMRAPFIDQRWLSAQMSQLADSPVVWIERIDQHRRVASYVAKYAGKDPHRFGTAKRYWESQDYQIAKREKPTRKFEPGHGYDRQDLNIDQWCKAWTQLGFNVSRLGRWRATATAPP